MKSTDRKNQLCQRTSQGKKLVLTYHPYLSAFKQQKTGKGETMCCKKHWGSDIQYFLILSGILTGI